MEVFFLDVAQGTCQVLLLGNRSAIVLDSGARNGRVPLQFLKRMGIDHLAALITTHSHDDHMGGATAILGEYQDMIDVIGFVKDDEFLATSFWARICELVREGTLQRNQLARLECNRSPQIVWKDETIQSALRVFAPIPFQNLQAEAEGNSNATSAVLILDVGERRIIFGADADLVEWRDIYSNFGPISCDILGVPHHGRRMHENQADLEWLYGEAIDADIAVVSVGTTNTYRHPREDVIHCLTEFGARVMCTQITSRCHDDLESVRSAMSFAKKYVGASSSTRKVTATGRSRSVPCAGTIRVDISQHAVSVESLEAHQSAVNLFASVTVCPLCRL